MSNPLNRTEKEYLWAFMDLTGVWQFPLTVFYKVRGEVDESQYNRAAVIREAYETLRGLHKKGLLAQRLHTMAGGYGEYKEYIQYRITDAGRVAIAYNT